jgi:putative transposase
LITLWSSRGDMRDRGLGAVPLEIGGIADHVHILMGIKATHRFSDMVREIKSESSRWVHS